MLFLLYFEKISDEPVGVTLKYLLKHTWIIKKIIYLAKKINIGLNLDV